MGCLTDLKYLFLRSNPIEDIPQGLIAKFHKLEVLDLYYKGWRRLEPPVVELESLNNIKALGIGVFSTSYLKKIAEKNLPIRFLSLRCGLEDEVEEEVMEGEAEAEAEAEEGEEEEEEEEEVAEETVKDEEDEEEVVVAEETVEDDDEEEVMEETVEDEEEEVVVVVEVAEEDKDKHKGNESSFDLNILLGIPSIRMNLFELTIAAERQALRVNNYNPEWTFKSLEKLIIHNAARLLWKELELKNLFPRLRYLGLHNCNDFGAANCYRRKNAIP